MHQPTSTASAPRWISDRIAIPSTKTCPRDLGRPFSTWSLSKLREVLISNGIADISRETVRQILEAEGVSWQAVKTWKAETDPEFSAKMSRVLDLYDHQPTSGRVVCVDEFGPLTLQPRAGRGWFPRRSPKRLPATGAPRACGTCSALWIYRPASSTIGSGIGSDGRSSCRC